MHNLEQSKMPTRQQDEPRSVAKPHLGTVQNWTSSGAVSEGYFSVK